MKLDDFLKYKKVRYINLDGKGLTNKEYELLGVTDRSCIISDNGCEIWASMDNFEPVLDSAENPLEGAELTSEFETEASEPKFEVGDKVYIPNIKNLCTIRNDGKVITSDGQYYCNLSDSHDLCFVLATQENYEMLRKLYPHIEFEAPPKQLTGSDLARAMVDKEWFIVDCYVSAISDEDALRFRNERMQVTFLSYGLFTDGVKQFPFAVPFDPRTGEPLTESVLND